MTDIGVNIGLLVDMIKRVDRDDAIGLIESALAVARADGVRQGGQEAFKAADDILARYMPESPAAQALSLNIQDRTE